MVKAIIDAWNTLNPDNVAQYYDKSTSDLFFDITPLKYNGWAEYAAGVKKVFAPYKSVAMALQPDLQIHPHGDLTWFAVTVKGDAVKLDGSKESMTFRWTSILEKKGERWLIVHDHFSVPLPPPPAAAPAPAAKKK